MQKPASYIDHQCNAVVGATNHKSKSYQSNGPDLIISNLRFIWSEFNVRLRFHFSYFKQEGRHFRPRGKQTVHIISERVSRRELENFITGHTPPSSATSQRCNLCFHFRISFQSLDFIFIFSMKVWILLSYFMLLRLLVLLIYGNISFLMWDLVIYVFDGLLLMDLMMGVLNSV